MAQQPLLVVLKTLEQKVTELGEIQSELVHKIKTLEEENANLRFELETKTKLLEQADSDIDFLTVSHKLADSPDALIGARRRIARLIRTIDNCISMLQEE